MTGGIPPPISLGMKRPGPGLGPIGPPNKVFRPVSVRFLFLWFGN